MVGNICLLCYARSSSSSPISRKLPKKNTTQRVPEQMKVRSYPHPYGMRSARNEFSHGLKKCPPDTSLRALTAVLSSPSISSTKRKKSTQKGGLFCFGMVFR